MLRGISLEGNKKMSISKEILDMCDVDILYVPLVNHSNLNCKCLVKAGEKIKKNDVIGMREDIELPILSPVTGVVKEISNCLYLNGEEVPCVVIERKGKDSKEKEVEDITSYTKEEFIELLKNCGVVGMGGSDFPTYIKYKTNYIGTLIVNAVECEPYITCDLMLSKLKSKEILEATNAIMEINNIEKCFIAIKEDNDIVINSFNKYISEYPKISIKTVKNMYPMGWERHTIEAVLGETYDKLPSEKGIVVNNVSTIYAIYKALKYKTSISKRLVTITGPKIKDPINVLVNIGTNIKEVVDRIGIKSGKELKFIAGGPMMGCALTREDVVVTKNLNCILVMEDLEELDILPCMRCGRCDQICPVKISPVLIKDFIENPDMLEELQPKKCMECGLCSYICPSKIDLRSYVKKAKKEVK